jgi:hypothetical protein
MIDSGDLFPANKIVIRRGVAYKDSDAPNHGRRYDILAALNEASTVPVPPREGGLIWINFDCRGAKPGIYRGAITVIPFNQVNTLVKLLQGSK